MKELSNKDLVVASLLSQGMPSEAIEELGIVPDMLDMEVDLNKEKLFYLDKTLPFKLLKKELTNRGIRTPLPIIPPPTQIVIQGIEIKPKKKDSGIVLPDTLKDQKLKLDMFDETPLQATVVAIGKEVKFPGLSIGSRIHLVYSPETMIIINGSRYMVCSIGAIGCVVF